MTFSKKLATITLLVLAALTVVWGDFYPQPKPLPEIKTLDLQTEGVGSSDFCRVNNEVWFQIYINNNPRFKPFANDPVARQRFLHNGAFRAIDQAEVCFTGQLYAAVFWAGNLRCNFNMHRDEADPILQADLDMIIQQIESRHQMMLDIMLLNSPRLNSNRLRYDTYAYLLQLTAVQTFMEPIRDLWELEIAKLSAERINFVVEAASRNDLRSVLRTNPPCPIDPIPDETNG
jgi:hypothetical protein